jgi:ATP-dependent DNA ligase
MSHCSPRNLCQRKVPFHEGLLVSSRPWIASPSPGCAGPEWTYEIKLDGYRLEAVRSAGRTTLYSRRQNVLNQKFHYIATALKDLPDDTVIDGELVALATASAT